MTLQILRDLTVWRIIKDFLSSKELKQILNKDVWNLFNTNMVWQTSFSLFLSIELLIFSHNNLVIISDVLTVIWRVRFSPYDFFSCWSYVLYCLTTPNVSFSVWNSEQQCSGWPGACSSCVQHHHLNESSAAPCAAAEPETGPDFNRLQPGTAAEGQHEPHGVNCAHCPADLCAGSSHIS